MYKSTRPKKAHLSAGIGGEVENLDREDPVIDGQRVNIVSIEHAIEVTIRELSFGTDSFMLCTLNMDHLVKRRENKEFAEAYSRALFVSADGFPVVLLARMQGASLERTTGSDLILPLCSRAARERLSVYLIGGTPESVESASLCLTSLCAGLTIAGTYAPPWPFDPASVLTDEIISAIISSGARVCLVALGAPLQELFAMRAIERSRRVAYVGVGASLDFLAGRQWRAPSLVRFLNLEWAWRLILNPRRLWLRYLKSGLLFVQLLGVQMISHYTTRRPLRKSGSSDAV
jgi:exopolysaccharide biosynthesis WecB/TagA/CpsF family protein